MSLRERGWALRHRSKPRTLPSSGSALSGLPSGLQGPVARADVPCGSCHACCRSEMIVLMPEDGDDVASYLHEVVDIPTQGTCAVLKHKPNGDCVYLGPEGCTIHDRAPAICRVFDCRRWYLSKTRAERRKMASEGKSTKAVLNAARARLATLPGKGLTKD